MYSDKSFIPLWSDEKRNLEDYTDHVIKKYFERKDKEERELEQKRKNDIKAELEKYLIPVLADIILELEI